MKIDVSSQKPILSAGGEVDLLLTRWFHSREIKRVLLFNPPDADSALLFRYDTAGRHRYMKYPPYGLAKESRINGTGYNKRIPV